MSEQIILISGAMGGMGKATTQLLAAQGHKVCMLYHATNRLEVEAFIASLTNSSHHTAFQCDLTNFKAVETVVAQATLQYGLIDVCVHSAVSKLVRRRISQIKPDEFRQIGRASCRERVCT